MIFNYMPIIYRRYIIKKLLLILLLPLATLLFADRGRQAEPVYETDVSFRGFAWGTSMDEFIKKMGRPVSRETVNGLVSLVWENIDVNGYKTFMLAYFSRNRLQGGTYYFVTHSLDELAKCYRDVQLDLRKRYGPTVLYHGIINEMRTYESSWHLPGGYVYLKVNTRTGDPVTLWYSSPELSRQLFGDREAVTAKR